MKKKITILGSGIVGICSALSLLEKNFAVEMIDREQPAEGASYGNAGVISPWSCIPQSTPGIWKKIPRWILDPQGPVSIRRHRLLSMLPWGIKFLESGTAEKVRAISDAMNVLNRPNLELYRQHLDGTGQEELVQDSFYLHVFRHKTANMLNDLAWQLRKERGAPLDIIDRNQLTDIEPALTNDYVGAIRIREQARALDPGAVGKALAEKAMSLGAVFTRTSVVGIRPTQIGTWTLQTGDGEIAAERLVVAAGAWSAELLEPLGFKLPLEGERGYHVVFRDPGIKLNSSIMDSEQKVVVSSMLAGVRCAGIAEFARLGAPPDGRRAKIFKTNIKKMIPNISTDDTVEWMGTRPSFPDSLPCIGPIPGYENLFAAFGHSHYGFGMAPNTGRLIAATVSGEPLNVDMTPYCIERFG